MSLQHVPLSEYRCACERLLFKGVLLTARVEIKCKRCGAITTFERVLPADASRYSAIPVSITACSRLDELPAEASAG